MLSNKSIVLQEQALEVFTCVINVNYGLLSIFQSALPNSSFANHDQFRSWDYQILLLFCFILCYFNFLLIVANYFIGAIPIN